MMTKKDFQAIAAAMYAVKPAKTAGPNPAHTQFLADIRAISRVFYAANPRFDIIRFLQACLCGKDSNSERVREQYAIEESERNS
jgi:hypothetical protein